MQRRNARMNEIAQSERKTLSVEEAAVALGIGRTLAYEAVRRGEIPTIQIGRRRLVPQGALDQLLSNSGKVGGHWRINRTSEQNRLLDEPSPAVSAPANEP